MKLIELLEKIVIPGEPGTIFRLPKPAGARRHARRSWRGRAYVATDDLGNLRIHSSDLTAPYSLSFEDLVAEDWELTE